MIHVIVPFGRAENLQVFVDHMRKQGVILHPLFEADRTFDFPDEPWIQPFRVNPFHEFTGSVVPGMVNQFIDAGGLEDEAHYHLFSDDCFVEEGYYERLAAGTKDVLITSTKRGQHLVATTGYGNETLFGERDNMRPGQVAGEQLHIRGRVLKLARAAGHMIDHKAWDGFLVDGFLVPKCSYQFEFFREVYSWFNYLEAGRWDK
jgi:hypothetical protein